MIAVVRGNDFRLRIPIRRNVVHNNGTTSYEPLDISALNNLHVFLEDETMCAKELEWFIDTENQSSIIADVPACMQEGKYALVLLGKYSDDRRFRSKERKQLRLVETNEKANVTPFDLDGFDAYALDTMIIMDGRGRDGLSAYEIAVAHGYEGTEEEWIESLHNVSDTDEERWNSKQDALTFDNTPTANSDNPVKSGGVDAAINNAIHTLNVAIAQETVRAEAAFYTLELQNATGSASQATELYIALNKNGGSEEDPETHGISTLTISQATENKAGLLPAKSKWDDEPITDSSNLVKSGGIKSAMDNMNSEIAEKLAKKQEKLVSTSLEITGNSIEIPFVNIPIGTLLEELEGTDEKHPRTVSAERLQYLFNTTTNLQKLMGKRAYGKYDRRGRYYTAPCKVILGENSGTQLAHVIFYLIDENKEVHINVSWLPGVLSFSPGTGYMKLNTNIENIFPINSNYRGSDRTTAPGLYLYNAGLDNGHFAPMLEEYATGLLIVTRESGIYSSGDGWNDVCQLFIDMNGNRYSRKLPYTNSVEDIDWVNAPDFVLIS